MKLKTKMMLAPSSIPGSVAGGVTGGLLVTILGAALISTLMLREILKETTIGYSAMVILLLASFAASKISLVNTTQKRWLIALITGISYGAILLILNGILYRGGYEGVGVTILLIMGGSIAALLLGTRTKAKRINPKRKRRHG